VEDQLNAFQCIEGHSSEIGFVQSYHTRGRLHSSNSPSAPLSVQFPALPTSSVDFLMELPSLLFLFEAAEFDQSDTRPFRGLVVLLV
jgi:hypothetical protein